jgi:flavin reductase (DIM6/NTAB) family NADH-FMN oxidoreductase RutF
MNIDFKDLEKIDIYRLLTHSVTPRPVAWALTQNSQNQINLAPYSYFNVICSDPATLMISVGKKRDGSKKDTWANIEATSNAVIHIANRQQMENLNQTASPLPHGESELDTIDSELVSQNHFSLPRIKQCPIAFNCKKQAIHLIGNGPQAVIYLEVVSAYLDEGLNMNEQWQFDAKALDPIARLGADDYSLLGDITTLARPQ